jgi:hypothetical protein
LSISSGWVADSKNVLTDEKKYERETNDGLKNTISRHMQGWSFPSSVDLISLTSAVMILLVDCRSRSIKREMTFD